MHPLDTTEHEPEMHARYARFRVSEGFMEAHLGRVRPGEARGDRLETTDQADPCTQATCAEESRQSGQVPGGDRDPGRGGTCNRTGLPDSHEAGERPRGDAIGTSRINNVRGGSRYPWLFDAYIPGGSGSSGSSGQFWQFRAA